MKVFTSNIIYTNVLTVNSHFAQNCHYEPWPGIGKDSQNSKLGITKTVLCRKSLESSSPGTVPAQN
jgi:hypothetical protein